MNNMFENYKYLEYLDLSSFITKDMIKLRQIFSNRSSLLFLDLASFNTNNIINVKFIFDIILNYNIIKYQYFKFLICLILNIFSIILMKDVK